MKKRAANFTPEEKNELLEAVLRHRDVLFGRVGPPSRYWAAKKAAWCDVVDAVNTARPSPGRNVHECRRKLKDLKAAARKKFMDSNGAWKSEGTKDATAEELKILRLLGSEDKEDEIDLSIVKIEQEEVDPRLVLASLDPRPSRADSDIVIGLISGQPGKVQPVKTPSKMVRPPPPPQFRAPLPSTSVPPQMPPPSSQSHFPSKLSQPLRSSQLIPSLATSQLGTSQLPSTQLPPTQRQSKPSHLVASPHPPPQLQPPQLPPPQHPSPQLLPPQLPPPRLPSSEGQGQAQHQVTPTATNPPRPQISVIPQAMLKMDHAKRPIGQVAPLPVPTLPNDVERQARHRTLPPNHTQPHAAHNLDIPPLPKRSHVLNVPLNYLNTTRTSTTKHAPELIAPLSVGRKHLRSLEINHGQPVPFAEFNAPEPMKRVKLFVRNVPALKQGTPAGPTSARGNVLNFAVCSCKDHPTVLLKDASCQTDLSENAIMLQSIIETQMMTARALQNLERIAQHARERGLFDLVEDGRGFNLSLGQKARHVTVKIENEVEEEEESCDSGNVSRDCSFDNTTEEPMEICEECTGKQGIV